MICLACDESFANTITLNLLLPVFKEIIASNLLGDDISTGF